MLQRGSSRLPRISARQPTRAPIGSISIFLAGQSPRTCRYINRLWKTAMMRAASILLLSTLLTTTLATLAKSEPPNREQICSPTSNAKAQNFRPTGHDASDSAVEPITGTGVIVSPSGTIVTALHVVKKDTEWFRYPDGTLNRHIQVTGLTADMVERSLGEASGERSQAATSLSFTSTGTGSFVGVDNSGAETRLPRPSQSYGTRLRRCHDR